MSVHGYAPADVEAALSRRYIVGPEIGVGGQGVVFRATRTSRPDGTEANDDLALKLYLYPSQDVRVRREIDAMQDVSHPNLARLIEHGYCDVAGRHTPYLAWEFIEGQPLSAHLKTGPLLESEVLAIGHDVSAAIAEIWSRRIVHGDIKPSNIVLRNSDGYFMVGSVDRAVLIDLGAARYLDQDNIRTLRPSRYLDPADTAATLKPMRTWGYSSPEQIRGVEALSCASDVFSLGVVMLQCLQGRHPTDNDEGALANGIQASGCRVAASAGLLGVLDKMLSPLPAVRPNPAEVNRHFQSLRQAILAKYEGGTGIGS
jgi:serine/threonine protein kinase